MQAFETRAVHPATANGRGIIPVTTPIYTASSFIYEDMRRPGPGLRPGARRPVLRALQQPDQRRSRRVDGVARIRRWRAGVQFRHGGAPHGDPCRADRSPAVASSPREALYGATISLLMKMLEPTGVQIQFVDFNDLEALQAAVDEEKPGALLMETISNPLLRVARSRPHRANREGRRRRADRGQHLRHAADHAGRSNSARTWSSTA